MFLELVYQLGFVGYFISLFYTVLYNDCAMCGLLYAIFDSRLECPSFRPPTQRHNANVTPQ